MKHVRLPNSQITSQLGFGGTVLKGGTGRAENLSLLDAAFDHGFRHFDVAPSYGLGVAEGILAAFISDKRDKITITSKVGLPRPRNSGLLAQARAIVRPLLSFAPGLRRRFGRSVQRMSGSAETRFDLSFVRSSVDESFRELRTEYLDLLLLHEITPEQVSDELRQYLDRLVVSGRCRAYGVGSYRHEAERMVHAYPSMAPLLQTSWTLGDAPLALQPHMPFMLTHGAVRPIAELTAWLNAVPERKKRLAALVDDDLDDQAALGDLMIAAALSANSDGIVLVSSTQSHRLRRHAEIAGDLSKLLAGARLHEAVLREKSGKGL
jgi:hypothetical protein